MKSNTLILLLVFVFLSFSRSEAQSSFKVMFYNLLNYPDETAVANREEDLEFIISDYQPDLFLVCELNNITGANTVLNITQTAIRPSFEMATFVSNTSDDNFGDSNDLQNLLYYDSSKFSLEEEVIVPTNLRDFNVYRLRLNTVNQLTNPVELYVIVCHLKASSGPDNAQRRFEMVQELDNYLNTLPSDSHVLLGGDLNLYTALESAFQELLDTTNNITFTDPANQIGNWSNNTTFIDVFTQSTRTQSGFGGSRGGFDDRFDFILTSENMLTSTDLAYTPDSYKVYGNNGVISCYNSRINSSNCAGPEYSEALREALHNFSDHLPVTIEIETSETLLNTNNFVLKETWSIEQSLVRSEVIINLNNTSPIGRSLSIYNQLGQLITEQPINLQQIKIATNNFSEGLYYVTCGRLQPLKFLVVK